MIRYSLDKLFLVVFLFRYYFVEFSVLREKLIGLDWVICYCLVGVGGSLGGGMKDILIDCFIKVVVIEGKIILK